MNCFFYASAASDAAEKFSERLRARDSLASMVVLPGGSRLNSHHSLELRSGDIMILFASTDKELEDLLAIYDKFEEFKVVLVLPKCDTELVGLSHRLKPRYISFIGAEVAELEEVVGKIQHSSITTRIEEVL